MPRRTWGGWMLLALTGGLFVGVGCDPGAPEDEASDGMHMEEALLPLSGLPLIPAALVAPVIDGKRDAQYQLGPAQPLKRLIRGSKPSTKDLSASFRALHDAKSLYLFLEVQDDKVMMDSANDIPWEDDAVEVFLDADERLSPRYDGVDDVQLVFRPRDSTVHLGVRSAPVRPSTIRFYTARTDTGYQLEVAIPWSSVRATWRKDRIFGLDVHVDDDDDGGARDCKLAWSSFDDEAWHRPDRFKRVKLTTGGGPGFFAAIGDLPGGYPYSFVRNLSASGEVLVGTSNGTAGYEAIRFTMRDGLVPLGHPPSAALAVSPNGALVAGYAQDDEGDTTGALWRGSTVQFMYGAAEHPARPKFRMLEPGAVLNDGRVFGSCLEWGAAGTRLGCRWDGPAKITLLPGYTIIEEVDSSGNVGGTYSGVAPPEVGPVAVLNDVRLGYPPKAVCTVPWVCQSWLRDFSAGAKVVVGGLWVPRDGDASYLPLRVDSAFVYTPSEGVVRLPDLDGGDEYSYAFAISGDGRVIAGKASDVHGSQGVLWIGRKPRLLSDIAKESGVVIPAGVRLYEVTDVSADGRTFAGNFVSPRGDLEGFLLHLAEGP